MKVTFTRYDRGVPACVYTLDDGFITEIGHQEPRAVRSCFVLATEAPQALQQVTLAKSRRGRYRPHPTTGIPLHFE